jgi:hypothetical protein
MKTLIFKTNIKSEKDFEEVKKTLSDRNCISEVTIDLEDVDKVLRVLADSLTVQEVEQEILDMGFYCKELED